METGGDRQLDDHTLEVAMSIIGLEGFKGDMDIKIILREFKLYDALGNEFKAQSSSMDKTSGVFKWEGTDVESEYKNNIIK